MEALQPVGSFKIRGIGRACHELVTTGVQHLVSSSGGNAGLAVAYAGRLLRTRVTVLVPRTTPEMMRAKLRVEGAAVQEAGDSWDDAHAAALALADAPNTGLIHPFEGEALWDGHATLVEECAEQGEPPDAIVVAVGGGGLLVGVLRGLHRIGWGAVPVVAVETTGAASLARSAAAGALQTLPRIDSLATSLGARTPAAEAVAWTQRHPIHCHQVEDRAAVQACARFADDHRVLVEPACGAALAACYELAPPLEQARRILVVVCGGAGVSPALLGDWLAKT